MKLANLLAQYLYTNKKLDLPGIGTFVLDTSVTVEQDTGRQNKSVNLEGVTFTSNTSLTESPDLVKYIASETGKIRALAAADLDSHVGLALQFINIGKPFLFEGIGSLAKINSGGFSFTPGTIIHSKGKEISASAASEEPATEYQSIFSSRGKRTTNRTTVVVLLIIAGIGLAVWGGYTVYKRTSEKQEIPVSKNEPEVSPATPQLLEDTSIQRRDSALPAPVTENPSAVPTGNFKFIVETANKDRGVKRFNTLKGYGIDIQLETKDSINYKLFFLLPASGDDTARMLDSLRIIYTPPGKSAYVEI